MTAIDRLSLAANRTSATWLTRDGAGLEAFVVETSRKTDRVGEVQPHHPHRVGWHRARQQTRDARGIDEVDASHADAMCRLGVESEK